MKKMYFFTITLIIIITAVFLLYSSDENTINRNFLSSYDIMTNPEPQEVSAFQIPKEFDNIYTDYNLLQIECGLDLLPYSGKKAVRYTYTVTNFPVEMPSDILVNVICVNHRPVAGDIMCPALSGFIKPLNFLMKY